MEVACAENGTEGPGLNTVGRELSPSVSCSSITCREVGLSLILKTSSKILNCPQDPGESETMNDLEKIWRAGSV